MENDRKQGTGLAQVYAYLRPQLLRFLTARLRNPHEAEEVLQDLAVRVLEARAGPVANPTGYIYRMALNLANDRMRQLHRRTRREAGFADQEGGTAREERIDPAPSQEGTLIAQQQAARIMAAMKRVPPGAARVLRMHKLEGRSHTEIAEGLGVSRSAVEKHMAVALRHLIRALRTEVGPGGDVITDD